MADNYIPLQSGKAVPPLYDKATSFNGGKNKYNVSNMTYPSDLHDPKYAGNMVVFYINIANASRFQPNNGNNIGAISSANLDTPRIRQNTEAWPTTELGLTAAAVGSNIAKDTAIGIAGGFAKGVADYAEKGLAGLLGTGGSIWKGAGAGFGAGIIANGADAVGFGAAASLAGTTTREQKRLTSAIALHMPNNLSIRYSVGWSEVETADLAMTSGVGQAAIKALQEPGISSLSGVGKEVLAVAANKALSGSGNAGAVSIATGLAPNPRKELAFKSVDYRTFTFDYKFFARSEEEANNILDIINAFKFHMHPEFKENTSSFLYIYPSEFDITYYTGNGTENMHIHRHTSCVLMDMQVNYAPNGNFNTFANGMPTEIDISLTFKELATMSKELIAKGL